MHMRWCATQLLCRVTPPVHSQLLAQPILSAPYVTLYVTGDGVQMNLISTLYILLRGRSAAHLATPSCSLAGGQLVTAVDEEGTRREHNQLQSL